MMNPARLSRQGPRLYSFAVVADSHLEPGGQAIPRSNARNRRVIDWVRQAAPEFVLHLGDIVHPVPEAPNHVGTLDLAAELYRGFDRPVLYTPGNHDIGDKPGDTSAAAGVTEDWLDEYSRAFGAPWQRARVGDCLFLLLNSPILNSGFALEAAQKRWLEGELAAARGLRVFLATHYPPFLVAPDEASHYDCIDFPARHWLLELIVRHRVEAVFCGHVHNFFYNRVGPTEIYVLPSTSFVRRDYSELFRGAPGDEFGRNDTGKLGFFWVDVYQQGHVARFVRTEGATEPLSTVVVPGHPKDPGETPLGLWLRHPWSELVDLPHNPPVDEFARRQARNDYAIQAIWDLGVRALRAPIEDLLDTRMRARVAEMADLGHRFTFFSLGVPDARLLQALREHAHLVWRWECVLPARRAAVLAQVAGDTLRAAGLRLALSNLRSAAQGNAGTPAGHHFTAPGFALDEIQTVAELATGPLAGLLSVANFRVGRNEPLEPALATLARFAAASGVSVTLTRAAMPDAPNDTALDDDENARHVAESLALARRYPTVELLLDTFIDVDRGYYVRSGLIDRRCNLRPAGRVLLGAAAARVQEDPPAAQTDAGSPTP